MTLNNIALVYKRQGRYEDALEHYGRSLKVKLKVHGEEHPSTGTTCYNMAGVYENQGRYKEAAEQYDAAARAYARAYGPEHEETVDALAKASAARAVCTR